MGGGGREGGGGGGRTALCRVTVHPAMHIGVVEPRYHSLSVSNTSASLWSAIHTAVTVYIIIIMCVCVCVCVYYAEREKDRERERER